MSELLQMVIDSDERADLRQFIGLLYQQEKRYLLRSDILQIFSEYCASVGKEANFYNHSLLARLIYFTQEFIVENESLCLVIRPVVARQEVVRINREDLRVEPMTIQAYLDLCDQTAGRFRPQDGDVLELDFQPFYDFSPSIRDPKNIGRGVQFLNRYLSSKLFQDPGQWLQTLFQFLRLHRYNGTQLLINERIQTQQQLSTQLKRVLALVSSRRPDEPYANFRFDMQSLGFEPGWGNTAARVRESLELLDALIDSPDHEILESLISRIPMLFRVVLVSSHGWFGQEGVLGRPDTGGQVVYVLDQARSLEKQLQEDHALAGLETTPKVIILTRLIANNDGTRSNQRLEKVYGTDNAWILRVPFREFNPSVTQNWISRFEIWPYLESFALDSERELLAELGGRPDLIVGNYSDGNLVAFLLARRLKVTQCNIAHALEKSKYALSNLHWQELDEQYHFSLQYTADLIAMNAANFIISSTYQEIAGTPDSMGQYESYRHFTMPELYHVVSGIDLFNPKFNVVPPGVNENIYFPYTRTEERTPGDRERLEQLLFSLEDSEQVFGHLADPTKRPLFSMARLDRIKNLTGLAECFAKSPELQERANLILVAGKLRAEDSTDREEIAEINRLYEIVDRYQLAGKIRWLGVRLAKVDSGEIYRVVADRQGIFVQPALFEAFGLTILESMISGLPTFATRFGGPLEIIQDGVNGFLINPNAQEEMAASIVEFLSKCDANPDYWQQISSRGIQRVYSTYTWKIHTTRLLSLARIYGFWNYGSQENREDLLRYIEMLFYLLYKPGAQKLLERHALQVAIE
ncbi:sucrose synthase [Gloeobacter kilaueensis]|uniref:Sucrose synthase n=1 Tax=Gloeobacter kilaueensis (strain ATCC BAA-2537 / CCAP 1431/1 / ULC 316 / JS1) TaxID=1183438 RepID=U5QN22_GLOK1|nr:sucrose synthase [Gloeobacter kilaueensis]AGY59080.1 sucrose-phosphate synthase [Gloeobacter kilaueensis JS1]